MAKREVVEHGPCPVCGAVFDQDRWWQRYCSDRCRYRAATGRVTAVMRVARMVGASGSTMGSTALEHAGRYVTAGSTAAFL